MFNSPVINLVILLAFTYFIASLLVSAIQEAFSGIRNMRGRQLKEWLETLFNDSPENASWKAYVQKEFQASPFIQSLQKEAGKFPVARRLHTIWG